MIKGGRMSGKSIDLGKSEGKFDTVFLSMNFKEWNEIQKKLKAFEIIKKNINWVLTLNYLKSNFTKEEVELLKEVLL